MNRMVANRWLGYGLSLFTAIGCMTPGSLMPLLPRWRFMTDEAKALTKRTAVSAVLVVLVLLVFRSLLPWVVLLVVVWWIWTRLRR
jgi:hypothetical protein